MRRPSPALVVAMVALFVALGGAGFAASLALAPVTSPKAVVMVPGSVSAAGKVTGARMTGGRVSTGVYTITISGGTFAPGRTGQAFASARMVSGGGINIPQICDVASMDIALNGSARAQVDCFTPGSGGLKPADAAFDLQIVGSKPS